MPYLYIELRDSTRTYSRRVEVPDVPAIIAPAIIADEEILWGKLCLKPELYYGHAEEVKTTPDSRFLLVTDDRSLVIYHASGTKVYEGDYECSGGSEIDTFCPVDIVDQTAGEGWWRIGVSDGAALVKGTIGTRPSSDAEKHARIVKAEEALVLAECRARAAEDAVGDIRSVLIRRGLALAPQNARTGA
jgi:hypothetical protein